MWLVTWSWCIAVAVTFSAVGSIGDVTRIQVPLPADRSKDSSSGIAGEKPEALLFLPTTNIVSSEQSRAVI